MEQELPKDKKIRPTKKQKELLAFIETFITEHGYSPSFREIMKGCNYNSVATVALHVNNLIKRGHLAKRDHSARSLEVVKNGAIQVDTANIKTTSTNSKWLFSEIDRRFKQAEQGNLAKIDELYVLVGAVNVLGFNEVGKAYATRLKSLH